MGRLSEAGVPVCEELATLAGACPGCWQPGILALARSENRTRNRVVALENGMSNPMPLRAISSSVHITDTAAK